VFESFARAIAQHPLRDYTSMKMVFIFPNLPDRINPMTALARRLQVRNQESVVLYSSSTNGLLGGEITSASEFRQGSIISFEISRRGAHPVSAELPSPQVISYEGRDAGFWWSTMNRSTVQS
jgi:hypothetical protein